MASLFVSEQDKNQRNKIYGKEKNIVFILKHYQHF